MFVGLHCHVLSYCRAKYGIMLQTSDIFTKHRRIREYIKDNRENVWTENVQRFGSPISFDLYYSEALF
jgi:hypothetical protein